MKKFFAICAVTLITVSCMSMTAFAATWTGTKETGWGLIKDNGQAAISEWVWADGDGDTKLECFYFNENGICVLDAEIQGYKVNKNGEWVQNGSVQKRLNTPFAADLTKTAANTTMDEYAAGLAYTGVYGTETAAIHADGTCIVFDVTLPWTAAECPDKWLEDTYYDGEHYKVMQNIASNALKYFGSSREVTENIYSSDGKLLKSFKYYGRPMG
ncbi:MAG: hypothetical protein Q4E54_04110 [Lachnospiraceae bacterium]|nr:hypothetical protein [Lachnospiraceae bacterium]